MTSSETQPRKRSTLSEETMWSVPAVPNPAPAQAPPAPTPAAPVQSVPPPAPVEQQTMVDQQAQVRDMEEARGRNKVRSALFAWAAAERKAGLRLQECKTEVDAAIARGTDQATLHAFAVEACQKHGVAMDMLSDPLRAAIGMAPQ